MSPVVFDEMGNPRPRGGIGAVLFGPPASANLVSAETVRWKVTVLSEVVKARLYLGDVDPEWFTPDATLQISVVDKLRSVTVLGHDIVLYGYIAQIDGRAFLLYSNHRSQFDQRFNLSVVLAPLAPDEVAVAEAGGSIRIVSVGKAVLDIG